MRSEQLNEVDGFAPSLDSGKFIYALTYTSLRINEGYCFELPVGDSQLSQIETT